MARRFYHKHVIASWVRPVVGLLMAFACLICSPNVSADPLTGSEYDVKIGFIYNFAKFVTWQKAAYEKMPGVLVFCYAADNPDLDVFSKLDGKTIKGRKIKVQAYQQDTGLDQSHILFFATQDKAFIQRVLDVARGKNILTIGEVDGFTQWGGVINFFEEGNRLRFKVNVDAVRRQRLKMSSQLLGSARIVREGRE